MSYLPNVILSIANIRHYYPAALALQREGYLKRFICSVGFTNNKFIKYLPKTLEKRASLRYYDEIEPSLIKTIAWAELIPRGLKAAQLMTPERTNWLVDQIYDWVAQVYIDPCEYFHFVVPSGLYSAKKAKKQGSIVIADVRTAHPDHQINIIKQENELWDFKIRNTDLFQIKSKAVFELADYIIVPSEFARYTFLQEGIR